MPKADHQRSPVTVAWTLVGVRDGPLAAKMSPEQIAEAQRLERE